MKSSEILLELFPFDAPSGDPAESDGFDGVDGFPEAVQQALLARAQGLTSAEFAVQQGISVSNAEQLYKQCRYSLQRDFSGAWANHFRDQYPGLVGQLREQDDDEPVYKSTPAG